VIYLDDLILLYQNAETLYEIGQEDLLFLRWLGWSVNIEKSKLIPSRTWTYLGWQWNSEKMTVQLKQERWDKALSLLRRTCQQVYYLKQMKTRTLEKDVVVSQPSIPTRGGIFAFW
jgi:hypothetical protein